MIDRDDRRMVGAVRALQIAARLWPAGASRRRLINFLRYFADKLEADEASRVPRNESPARPA